ncbi:MAG: dTDP-4-dehydrorhamnose 3,5-epimerase [Pseudomonadota bacterium]|nr:dTDP-4-dehydrorhamnose 3,5-epimerase [Pseudomonadota bacterium]
MKFSEAPLAGAYVIDLDRVADERGFFARSFCETEFAARGLPPPLRQSSVSFNAKRGTLRGLHFQAAPDEEEKLVRCTAGAIFDVIVDLRPASATHRRWFAAELSAVNHRSLYVPKGFAHGFMSLTDSSEVLYMISAPFVASAARGVRWDDPAIGIEWPMAPTVMCARDAGYPLLRDGA